LKNVCHGVKGTISPKQPHSPTGNIVALSSVTTVNIATMISENVDTKHLNTPVMSNTPRSSSNVDNSTAIGSEIDIRASKPYVAKYLSTYIDIPTGSIHLVSPENRNVAPTIQRIIVTPIPLFDSIES
jgi:hypothetical protein